MFVKTQGTSPTAFLLDCSIMMRSYDAYASYEAPYPSPESAGERPPWAINLRWLCGLLAVLFFIFALAAISLWRASRSDVALPILQGALLTTFFPDGVSNETLATWQQQSEVVEAVPLLEGVALGYRPSDLRGLDARQASLTIVKPLAESVMQRGVLQGLNAVEAEAQRNQLADALAARLQVSLQQTTAEVLLGGALSNEKLKQWRARLSDAQQPRLRLLAGLNVSLAPQDLAGLEPEAASLRLLEPLVIAIESQGIQAALIRLEDDQQRAQLRQLLSHQGRRALNDVWLSELFPEGIRSQDRSSWRAQLSASPRVSVELAPGITINLTREALNNDGLDAALQARLEPLSLTYLREGADAFIQSLDNRAAQAAFRPALPAARQALRNILASFFYPEGSDDPARLAHWQARLADAGKGSLPLLPGWSRAYQWEDIEGRSAEAVEAYILAPFVDTFIAAGAAESVSLLEDASVRARLADAYQGLMPTLQHELATLLLGTLDDPLRLRRWQQALDAPNQWVRGLPSALSAPLSRQSLAHVQPREAGLQLLRPFAELLYTGGLAQQLYDSSLQHRLERTLQPLSFLLPRGRVAIAVLSITLLVLSALCSLLCLMLSDGLNKLGHLGLILSLGSLPAMWLSYLLNRTMRTMPSITSPPLRGDSALWQYWQDSASYLWGFVPSTLLEFVNLLSTSLCVSGLVFILIALSLGAGQHWQQRNL